MTVDWMTPHTQQLFARRNEHKRRRRRTSTCCM